jgi:hypothetical protein
MSNFQYIHKKGNNIGEVDTTISILLAVHVEKQSKKILNDLPESMQI